MKIAGIRGYDWLTGGVVAAIGLYVATRAYTYEVGSASHMGPGYMPMAAGMLLIIFGAAIIFIEGRRTADEEIVIQPQWRSLIFICLSLASFAALIESAGLVPAVFATVILSCLANKNIRLLPAIALAVFAVVFIAVVFVWALQIPVNLITW